MTPVEQFNTAGWISFQRDAGLEHWLSNAGPAALATRHAPEHQEWLRGDGTWFVGVNALENGETGAIAGSGPLKGAAIDFARGALGFGQGPLDRAQVSICYPRFPKPNGGESDAAFRFRLNFDAAHVDGLHPVGSDRRRKLLEYQGFLLGIPITSADAKAAPLVVWEGSHLIMQRMFQAELGHLSTANWGDVDLTDAYHQARTEAFATCNRAVVHVPVGAAYILHRMALHGVAPWQEGASADDEGRAVLYFRPEIARQNWLNTATDAVTGCL